MGDILDRLKGLELPAAAGILLVVSHAFLAACWLQKIVSKVPPGFLRLLAVLPTVTINAAIPFLFDERFIEQKHDILGGVLKTFCSFLIMWLMNCKILGYILARGVLVESESWHIWRFFGVLILPILPKKAKREDADLSKDPSEIRTCRSKVIDVAWYILRGYFKLAMVLLFAYIIWQEYPQTPWREPLYCYGLMYLLGTCFDYAQAVALAVFNIETIDSFNHPYFAQSLVDLWGARWNIMTAAHLKPLSYDIVLDGRLVSSKDKDSRPKKKRPEWVRALATIAIFVLSGLFHLIVFWYLVDLWAWEWMLFFFMFGPLMIVERAVTGIFEQRFGKKKRTGLLHYLLYLRYPLGVIYSNGGTLVLASFLFVPPIDRANIRRSAQHCYYFLIGQYID